jgi:hypothetical protein
MTENKPKLTPDEIRTLTEWLGKCYSEDGYWWCGHCNTVKSPYQVTYYEKCTVCKNQVKWVDCSRTFTTLADAHALMEKMIEITKWADFQDYLYAHRLACSRSDDFSQWLLPLISQNPIRIARLVLDFGWQEGWW